MVKFRNVSEICTFFDNAMKNRFNSVSIQRIAKDVAPSYCCRSIKHKRVPSDQELLKILYSQIENGNARVVLINDGLQAAHKQNVQIGKDDKNLSKKFDFLDFAKRKANSLKEVFCRIVSADFHILEKIIHIDENTTGAVPVVVESSTVTSHSTGWKAWSDPFDIRALGAFKGAVGFSIANFMGLSKSALAAATIGAKSELVTGQYMASGKSIVIRKWYGSFSLRYNLRTGCWVIPWVKYKTSGPDERIFVELKRKDRILLEKKVIYEHPEVLISPFQSMEDYLSNYHKGFVPPEHDVNKPIVLGRFFESIF
jgi:hypothetical protein